MYKAAVSPAQLTSSAIISQCGLISRSSDGAAPRAENVDHAEQKHGSRRQRRRQIAQRAAPGAIATSVA